MRKKLKMRPQVGRCEKFKGSPIVIEKYIFFKVLKIDGSFAPSSSPVEKVPMKTFKKFVRKRSCAHWAKYQNAMGKNPE